MIHSLPEQVKRRVALLAEGVDRNSFAEVEQVMNLVALLAEGVDRNARRGLDISVIAVALLAEGVDRNLVSLGDRNMAAASPSSRRSWIEIFWQFC